jgi:DNA (cytosine-5)-methyltransferase 1
MMDRRPRVLDLFCGAGLASNGYARAGFEVTGVDLAPMPNYPHEFIRADAVRYLAELGELAAGYDLIHASPPCQAYSKTWRIRKNDHPRLIEPVQQLLRGCGVPYVVENVEGAPLADPVLLCGAMFGLRTYDHRILEASFTIPQPPHPAHTHDVVKMGRAPRACQCRECQGGAPAFMIVAGNVHSPDVCAAAYGFSRLDHWVTRGELGEGIPPAYTEHVARAALRTGIVGSGRTAGGMLSAAGHRVNRV